MILYLVSVHKVPILCKIGNFFLLGKGIYPTKFSTRQKTATLLLISRPKLLISTHFLIFPTYLFYPVSRANYSKHLVY